MRAGERNYVPTIEIDHLETPSPLNPLGVKGAGEAGTVGATPAVMNAVIDALDAGAGIQIGRAHV